MHSISPPADDPLRALPLLIVANRAPVTLPGRRATSHDDDSAHGGLVNALMPLTLRDNVTWLALAPASSERPNIEHYTSYIDGNAVKTCLLSVPQPMYHCYYDRVSNEALWFLQHYLLHADITFDQRFHDAWHDGYVRANQAVADAIVAEIHTSQANPIVLLQDYHLYLVAGVVRRMLPAARLVHFVHIPWPEVRCWHLLPHAAVIQILTSLLQCHIVGLQTDTDVQNFVTCVAHFFPTSEVQPRSGGYLVRADGHQVLVRACPIPVDASYIRSLIQHDTAQHHPDLVNLPAGCQVILRADRIDPAKNILRGLQAFALLLDQHPSLQERVRFVMALLPERQNSARYHAYARQVRALASEINQRYSADAHPPVILLLGTNHRHALKLMETCDVFLANSLIDGMHLASKEAAVLNRQDGVIVLSRTTGTYRELCDGACLGITPTDLQETADALFAALTMPSRQRHAMATRARRLIESRTTFSWLQELVADLSASLVE